LLSPKNHEAPEFEQAFREACVAGEQGLLAAEQTGLDVAKPSLQYRPAIISFLGYNPSPPGKGLAARLDQCRTALGMSRKGIGEATWGGCMHPGPVDQLSWFPFQPCQYFSLGQQPIAKIGGNMFFHDATRDWLTKHLYCSPEAATDVQLPGSQNRCLNSMCPDDRATKKAGLVNKAEPMPLARQPALLSERRRPLALQFGDVSDPPIARDLSSGGSWGPQLTTLIGGRSFCTKTLSRGRLTVLLLFGRHQLTPSSVSKSKMVISTTPRFSLRRRRWVGFTAPSGPEIASGSWRLSPGKDDPDLSLVGSDSTGLLIFRIRKLLPKPFLTSHTSEDLPTSEGSTETYDSLEHQTGAWGYRVPRRERFSEIGFGLFRVI
jgi:hypothetical protein